MHRSERFRFWLERVTALPTTLGDLNVWGGWLRKVWAWLLVAMPGPAFWLRSWLADRILEVLIVLGSVVVSAYGVRILRAQARDSVPRVQRFQALTPRIREARDAFHRRGAGFGLRFISLVVELAVHLEALDIPCPSEPETVNDLEPWLGFLEKLLPLAELGRLEQALTLRDRLAAGTRP